MKRERLIELENQASQISRLEDICEQLAEAKRICLESQKKQVMSPKEIDCLIALLCGIKPEEIAEILNVQPRGLNTTLSQSIYKYVKKLYEIKTGKKVRVQWSDIPQLLLEDLGYKRNDGEEPTSRERRVKVIVLLELDIDEFQQEATLDDFHKIFSNASLRLQTIQPGSVVLILSSCQEGFEWIQAFFRAGLLTEMLGVPVLDVRLESQAEENRDPVAAAIALVDLKTQRDWLESLYQRGWQPVEQILAPAAHRGDRSTTTPEAIADLIPLLQPENSESTRRRAAAALGDASTGNGEAIAALTELLETTQDEETLWQAAIALGKIDPDNLKAAVRRAKRFHLEVQPEPLAIALVVAARPNADGRISIRLGVEPVDAEAALPRNLKLAVLHKSGDAFIEARSAGTDKYLQGSFRASVGKEFTVRLSLEDVSVAEDFVI